MLARRFSTPVTILVLLLSSLAPIGCGSPEPTTDAAADTAAKVSPESAAAAGERRVEWALALHGGAGVISKDLPDAEKQAYYDELGAALATGREMLAAGKPSLDVVEAVVRQLEDSPLFNAGKGAVFTSEGTHELDAAIMDGRDLSCGAVASITTVKNPVGLARQVMESSRHVFLVGAGAERFADERRVERVDPKYFFVQKRYDQWRRRVEAGDDRGTVGAVALDRDGNLAAATSTGGLTDKRFGRIGDVPVIGAGTYANNATVAVSATGIGEQFIRHSVAHDISALVEYRGLGVVEAAEAVVHGKLDRGDGGVIAVGRGGEIALVFNSEGMFRAAADAAGLSEVAIWEPEDRVGER